MVDIVTLPSCPPPTDATFTPVAFGTSMQGPLGGSTQRVLRLGDRFRVDLAWSPMTYDDARKFIARLLRAASSPAAIAFPQRGLAPVFPGALRVGANGAAGGVLPVSGGTPGFTLKEGQFFSLSSGGRRWIHNLQSDVVLDGGGAASLPINPLLRVQPAVNDGLEFVTPMMEGFVDQNWSWTVEMLTRVGLKLSITEDR